MKQHSMTLSMMTFAAAILLAMPTPAPGQATPPPFNAPARSTKMACAYCHSLHGGTVVTRGTAAIEATCMSCHNGTYTDPVTGRTAVLVATHENSRTGYGAWRVSCLGCHSPHRNAKAEGSEAVNPPSGYGEWMLIGDWVPEANSSDGIARVRRPVINDPLGNNGTTDNRRYEDDVMDGYYCSNTRDIDTPANSGAIRSANVVTVKTTASHGLSAGQSVRIGGVTNSSFNGGPFTIVSVPNAKTFTFSQTGPNATSGNGIATTGIADSATCLDPDPPSPTDQVRKVVFYDNRYPGTPALNQWAQPDISAPTTPGAKWYNGACNVCHTRTTHHRRDNSTPVDHGHNVTRACHDCHLHDKGWIK